MAEGGRAKSENGRAYLGVGYYLDAEDVGEARAAVVAEGAKDEVLTFLVEYEDTGEHGGVNGASAGYERRISSSMLMLKLRSRCRGIAHGPCSLKQGSHVGIHYPPSTSTTSVLCLRISDFNMLLLQYPLSCL